MYLFQISSHEHRGGDLGEWGVGVDSDSVKKIRCQLKKEKKKNNEDFNIDRITPHRVHEMNHL